MKNTLTDNIKEGVNEFAQRASLERFKENGVRSIGFTPYREGIIVGANWQKEQLSLIIEGYGESLELLKGAKDSIWESDEGWRKYEAAIKKGQSLLSNLKNK